MRRLAEIRFNRFVVLTLAVAAGLFWTIPTQALAANQCNGTDMMPGIKLSNAALHARITGRADRIPNGEAILWKIERAGVAPSYLFGTMHVSDPRVAQLSPVVRSAVHGSRTVAVEVAEMSPTTIARLMAKLPTRFIYQNGQSLEQKLAPEEIRVANNVMRKAGLPRQVARLLRPWFVNLLLSAPQCERLRSASGHSVLDQIVADTARNRGIKLVGLETPEEQIKALADMPEAVQLGVLRISLTFANRLEDYFETMIRFYLDRRVNLLMPLSIEMAKAKGLDVSSLRSFEKALAIKRNYTMRDRALPLIEKGRAFVAVGILHLVGREGLVELLRQQGYSVTAVE
ncbi:MAG: TraB/GumN family protein [Hyphomicrobiaceae bacterium]